MVQYIDKSIDNEDLRFLCRSGKHYCSSLVIDLLWLKFWRPGK